MSPACLFVLSINIEFLPADLSVVSMISLAVVCALVSAVIADGPPAYGPPPSYEKEAAQPYSYQYAVQDDYSGSNFAASENSDAKVVTGTYTVHLPDGRIQTVKYTADHYNGYVADVSVSIILLHANLIKSIVWVNKLQQTLHPKILSELNSKLLLFESF